MTDKVNLIKTIANEPRFSKFSSYLQMSGADAALALPGQFTVFVPSDDAFSKIPDIEMNELLTEAGRDSLKALLSYHIVPGKIMAASVGAEAVRASITGEEIKFADYRGLKVNGVGVLRRNIEATNGVVHSLETVLTRPEPAVTIDRPTSSRMNGKDHDAANINIDTSKPIF
jgi:uncharacterized surface protein with fasciclin (FAS1) repeats